MCSAGNTDVFDDRTGADSVVEYHHNTRITATDVPLKPQSLEKGAAPLPAIFSAHLDHSSWGACTVLRRELPNEAEALLHGRVVLVNASTSLQHFYISP